MLVLSLPNVPISESAALDETNYCRKFDLMRIVTLNLFLCPWISASISSVSMKGNIACTRRLLSAATRQEIMQRRVDKHGKQEY